MKKGEMTHMLTKMVLVSDVRCLMESTSANLKRKRRRQGTTMVAYYLIDWQEPLASQQQTLSPAAMSLLAPFIPVQSLNHM
jgi:hypothetical protein